MPSSRVTLSFYRRAGLTAFGVAGAVLLAGCGSSSSTADKTTAPPAVSTSASTAAASSASGSSAPTTATTAGGSAIAQFITKAEALCASTSVKAKAVADPTGPTDFTGIQSYTASVLKLAPAFYDELTTLAAATPDSAELNSKWISIEKADFAVAKPLFEQLAQAAAAKNATLTGTLFTSVGNLPDNSSAVSSFLTTYGLPTCAEFEGS